MLPKNQSVHSAAPRPKNQNSSVAHDPGTTVASENAPKKVFVSSQAIGSRKRPTTAFNQRRGIILERPTRDAGLLDSRRPVGRRPGFDFCLTRGVILTAQRGKAEVAFTRGPCRRRSRSRSSPSRLP